ncbi:MAG: hypothetical protein R3C69_14615 [Geminicoccaceae bacterium]
MDAVEHLETRRVTVEDALLRLAGAVDGARVAVDGEIGDGLGIQHVTQRAADLAEAGEHHMALDALDLALRRGQRPGRGALLHGARQKCREARHEWCCDHAQPGDDQHELADIAIDEAELHGDADDDEGELAALAEQEAESSAVCRGKLKARPRPAVTCALMRKSPSTELTIQKGSAAITR